MTLGSARSDPAHRLPCRTRHPARRPERVTLEGRWITLAPLDARAHAEALYEGSQRRATREARLDLSVRWALSRTSTSFAPTSSAKAQVGRSAVLRHHRQRLGAGAVGYQTFMRIEPANRVIEVGNIMYTPAMQRTAGATEAQYLFARSCLRRARLSPLRMEVQRPQRALASARRVRFGFTFEGVFRQHMIVKGRNRDTAWFAMLDCEWPRARGGFRALARAGQFRCGGAAEGLRCSSLMPKGTRMMPTIAEKRARFAELHNGPGLLRHAQSVGRRLGQISRLARLQGAGDHQRRHGLRGRAARQRRDRAYALRHIGDLVAATRFAAQRRFRSRLRGDAGRTPRERAALHRHRRRRASRSRTTPAIPRAPLYGVSRSGRPDCARRARRSTPAARACC